MKEYLATSDLPELSPEEMQAIDSISSEVHFRAFVRSNLCTVDRQRRAESIIVFDRHHSSTWTTDGGRRDNEKRFDIYTLCYTVLVSDVYHRTLLKVDIGLSSLC